MSKKLIINAIEHREVRAAILDNGKPINFFIERTEKKHQKGNIYRAKITSIEPHLQAAFVELEHGQHGFLSVSDVLYPDGGISLYQPTKLSEKKHLSRKGKEELSEDEIKAPEIEEKVEGTEEEEAEKQESDTETDNDTGEDTVAELEGDAVNEVSEVEVDTALMGIEDNEPEDAKEAMKKKNPKIEEILEVGQYLVVQIIKEGIGRKAPMVTTFISMAGHYLVLTPGNERCGISRQVRDQEERSRLKKFMEKAKLPDKCGLIVRTAATSIILKDLQSDLVQLKKNWRELCKSMKKSKSTCVLKKEEGLITRLIRDYGTSDIEEIVIDDPDAFKELNEFFSGGMSERQKCLKLHEEDEPIFTHYKLDESIKVLFKRSAPLPGGGSLIFDQGEAMLVIDINSGTFKEGVDDEDTAFKLNMLACKEIARQVQMRDVGGIIMVDFVDMRRISNRNKVERELEKAFKGDKAKVNITHIGSLGVMEMSRQRTKDSLKNSLYASCRACEGTGLVPSRQYTAFGILRSIREQIRISNTQNIKLFTTNEVAIDLLNYHKSDLIQLEEQMENAEIQILTDPKVSFGDFYVANRGNRNQKNRKGKAKKQNSEDYQNNKRKKKGRGNKPRHDNREESRKRPLQTDENAPSQGLGVIPHKDEKDQAAVDQFLVNEETSGSGRMPVILDEDDKTVKNTNADADKKEETSGDEKKTPGKTAGRRKIVRKKPVARKKGSSKRTETPKVEQSEADDEKTKGDSDESKSAKDSVNSGDNGNGKVSSRTTKRKIGAGARKKPAKLNLKKEKVSKNTEAEEASL